jgi:hypothetical protein
MASHEPIILLAASPDAPVWAHCICRWLRMGPLFFRQLPPMPLYGPIAHATAAADGFAWAHYFFGSFSRCPCMGPLHKQQPLLMASHGPIIFSAASPDAPVWAHCTCSSCCQWLRMGPSFFRQLLLMLFVEILLKHMIS